MTITRPDHGDGSVAVVFDLDGVVLDSEHLWEEMWVGYAARSGTGWTAADTAHVQGMSAPEWSSYLAGRAGAGESPEDCERSVVDGMVRALADGRMEPYPGAPDMVRECAGRVPVALATSAPRRLIDAVLYRHGLSFGATVSSAEVERGKPSPDVYREAARRLGVAPARCVAVEDSSNGIRAAHAAGMTVVALPNPTYPPAPDALELAVRVADDVHAARREVLALLDGGPGLAPHEVSPGDAAPGDAAPGDAAPGDAAPGDVAPGGTAAGSAASGSAATAGSEAGRRRAAR